MDPDEIREQRDMGHLVLLGDSTFDNAAYVRPGETVLDSLKVGLPDRWRATLVASDGSMIGDIPRQLERVPADATHLVLSVGGNDLMGEASALGVRVETVGQGMRLLADIRDRFDRDYLGLLDALDTRGLPAAVCTIYNPRFPDATLQREAVAALGLFNDIIIRAAHDRRVPVIELRALCTDDDDFATPIEPSGTGAEKIARAICDLVSRHDFSRRQAIIWP
jgi:hypothetical protein